MTAKRTRQVLYGGGAVVLAGVILLVMRKAYFAPRAELLAKIETDTANLAVYEAGADRLRVIQRQLQGVADRTLGESAEVVDDRFRSRLNRIAEHAGLQEKNVVTTPAVGKGSPREHEFARWKDLQRELDFVEVGATVTGQGTLSQALELVDRIQSEKWIKRIDQVKLDPVDNGERLRVSVKVATLFVPGMKPAAELGESYDPARFARVIPVVQANPFRLPPPAAAPEAVTSKGPETTKGFAYEQWAVTGLAEGPEGPEVWLVNQQSKEQMRLGVGQALQEAVFVAIRDDVKAEFQIGSEPFLIELGGRLSDRVGASQ